VDQTVNVARSTAKLYARVFLVTKEVHLVVDLSASQAQNVLKTELAKIKNVLILAQERADKMQNVK
jgi:hypothetical protein